MVYGGLFSMDWRWGSPCPGHAPLWVPAVQYAGSMEDRRMPFPKDTHVLIAGTCECGHTLQYRRGFADVVDHLEMGRSSWIRSKVITQEPFKKRRGVSIRIDYVTTEAEVG